MKILKECTNKLRKLFLKNIVFSSYLLIILILGVVTVPRIFAQPQAVKYVEIFSEKLDYEKKDPGAWKIKKSAKWISKGTAEITFDVDTVLKSSTKYTDVLLVLDISGSMDGEKLGRVKADSIQLIESLLSNDKNRVGLITFDSVSEVLSNFTNDKDTLFTGINNLSTKGATNYYKALTNVDNVLKNYTKENDRECVVLFLTDGFPCEETPNEVGQYSYLKSQYPFITINGVQYEMGSTMLDSVKNISDNQYVANMNTLNNVLFEAAVSSIAYDNFEITDYIDTNYFYVEDEKDINVSQGNIIFDKENQKFTWSFDNFSSGTKSKITIKAKLKDELIGEGGFYPTNEKEEIKSKLDTDEEDITSTKTPVLADSYRVIYDGNDPNDCRVEGVPGEKQYSVFDTVAISDSVPKCKGYKFKGWDVITRDVEKVNDDYFTMPEEDVILKANWSKLDIKKSMEGTVKESLTLYEQVKFDVNYSSKYAKEYTGDKSTFNGNQKVYYYYGEAANNNVLFANYCWKIVRTTDTGGVKLLYNGVPNEEGKCNNTDEDSALTKEQMNTSSATIVYNSVTPSAGDVGYMYNEANISKYAYDAIIPSRTGKITYIINPLNFEEYSVIGNDETSPYTFDSGENKWLSNNHTDSSESTIEFKLPEAGNYYLDYSISSENYDKATFYVDGTQKLQTGGSDSGCIELENITTSSVIKVTYSKDSSQSGVNDNVVFTVGRKSDEVIDMRSVYGNDFIYENGLYSLKDTNKFILPEQVSQLTNYHYTCFNTTGTCDTLYYIYRATDYDIEYVSLNNGKRMDDVLLEALYNSDVNKNDSTLKKALDFWYENNMTEYTSYLEDAVWCNDRSPYDYGGWDPNGDSFSYLYFTSYGHGDNLFCPNKNDRFTVSSDNGNGALKYPVGAITVQELNLAFSNNVSPLASGALYWTMTPVYHYRLSFVYRAHNNGATAMGGINRNIGVRPTISLRSNIRYFDGDGSCDSPYVIDMNS